MDNCREHRPDARVTFGPLELVISSFDVAIMITIHRAIRMLVTGLVLLLLFGSAAAKPRIKVLKLAVTNPTDELRLHEDIVVNVSELKKIAPDFRAGDAIVTTSDAATLDEDARVLQTIELPSQADDLDGDNKFDELAFQIDLKPKQTRIVTIAYGETATMQRLRSDYPRRTAAKFTMKFDGLGWESEQTEIGRAHV